jgi:hypothetical protein
LQHTKAQLEQLIPLVCLSHTTVPDCIPTSGLEYASAHSLSMHVKLLYPA